MDDDTLIHRIGPKTLENFRLKDRELRLNPVGISVLIGGTSEEASETMKAAFDKPEIQNWAQKVASAKLGDIRAAGFDVIEARSRSLPNHGRLVHPDGWSGFQDATLSTLFICFQ